MNTVLATTVKHQTEFDRTVDKLEVLITGLKNRADPLAAAAAHISSAAGTLADLLGRIVHCCTAASGTSRASSSRS